MPRIRCHYLDCVFLDDGYCGAAAIELDPDAGCMTFKRADEIDEEEEWEDEDEELIDEDEWDELEDEEDLWLDEDEEDY
ncbi:MAG: hypothetical protein RML93_11060 [Anaerolineales bacterium]|nr:hypothetical protein [Anaerolineales bacterium]MCS7247070.1 hypothetical protein [Anaerolineales bacterium]MDW8160881.1 hypothetical protein [Anaerolineales bacterium]MDW8447815.1 hypothetical protein [Anaerolineales bacterium]